MPKKIDGSDKEKTVQGFLEGKPPFPNTYTWDKYEKEYLQMVIAVYSIGIQMEKDSIKFYQEAKEKFDDERAKALFSLLISWKEVHLQPFTERYTSTKMHGGESDNSLHSKKSEKADSFVDCRLLSGNILPSSLAMDDLSFDL